MEFKICRNCQRVELISSVCTKCKGILTIEGEDYFIGKTFGKYTIQSIISSGGMAIIYKASHIGLNKVAAIKILLPEIANAELIERFKREAQLLAELKHPHIVEIYDFDLSSYELPFFVMEYLEGSNLRAEILKYPNGMPYDKFCKYFQQICSALKYAHSKGIVHRDLKPENIFIQKIAEQENIKILDFGIAKLLSESETSMQLTLTGSIMGTPYYISPEQIKGENIGTHTDQYALALIAAEMLTGKTIRAGKTFNQIITSDIYEPITINHIEKKDLPKNIINALNKATQPNISSRFKNISELENELLAHQSPTSLNIPTINVSIPTHKKKSSKIIAIVLILILLASITLLVKSFYKKNGNIEMQEYKLPPDINFLLGYSQNFLIAKGLENLYAIDINNLQNEPFKLYFKNDEIFISFLPNSDLLFAKNNSLWIRHYFLEQNITFEDELFLKELPKYKQIAFSPSAELLAIENETSVEAYRIKNQNLIKIFEFRKPDLQLIKLTISDKYLALIFKNNLKVFDLQQREKILDELIPMGTTCIQVLDLAHIVLIAGWYDEIFIFDLISKNKKSVSFPGQTFFIQYLPDNPTLLISKLEKFIIWDLNKNKEKFILERKGAFFESAILGLNGIYVYEKSTKHLIIIQYNSYKEIKNIKVSSLPIWALSYDKITNKAYAGGQDGILYEINIGTNEITQHKLHTQGITSIIAKDNLLITASDDKTIAVWKIPEMQILYRSQAHEYLINFLYLSPEGGKLWSSSSDGSIKMLNLPSLEKMQEIQIKNYSLQAFWINKEQDFIIAGTWNHRLLYLKKINGNWQLEKEIPLESKVIYSVAYLPNVNLILIAGLIPNILYVYDLEKNYFTEIKETYLAINWIQAISPKEAIGAADNALIYFNFERNPESIIAKIKISINSSLKFPLISEYFKNKSLIITGNIYGEITVSSLYDTLNSIEYTVNIPISNHT